MGSGAIDLEHLYKLQYLKYASFEAFAVLWLRIPFFWDMMRINGLLIIH